MFAGFPSTNTPAIQVWDFYTDVSSTARNSVYLTDDCAPIQFFKTGNNNAGIEILVYLPTSPIEGKTITIVNQQFGSGTPVYLYIKTSDRSGNGSTGTSFILGFGGMLLLVYSKQVISYGTATGVYQSGWIALNQGSGSAANAYSVALGGTASTASGSYSAVVSGSSNSAGGQYAAVIGGSSNSASIANSAVIGGGSNSVSGSGNRAFIGGGLANNVSGSDAGILAGSSNSASGSYSAVLGGSSCYATNSYAAVLGGSSNQAQGNASTVVGGQSNTAASIGSSVLGSYNSTADAAYSSVIGGRYGSTRSILGYTALPASVGPVGSVAANQQSALLILGVVTTNATVTTLRSDTSAASTTNQIILPNNSAYYFRGSVIANVTGGGNTKAWSFEGAIKRGANAGTTTLIQSVINPVASDTGAEAWIISLSADTTNGGLKVDVTGAASTTIRWVCKVETTEVTY